jgi:hypothetical protein
MNRFTRTFLPVLLSGISIGVLDAQTETKDQAWVQARVQEIEVKKEERRLDEIGWAKDIRDAERLAKQSGRPVFLFTHDGRLNIGRC